MFSIFCGSSSSLWSILSWANAKFWRVRRKWTENLDFCCNSISPLSILTYHSDENIDQNANTYWKGYMWDFQNIGVLKLQLCSNCKGFFVQSWDWKGDLKQWILGKTLVRIDYCPASGFQTSRWTNCICAKYARMLGDGRDGRSKVAREIIVAKYNLGSLVQILRTHLNF